MHLGTTDDLDKVGNFWILLSSVADSLSMRTTKEGKNIFVLPKHGITWNEQELENLFQKDTSSKYPSPWNIWYEEDGQEIWRPQNDKNRYWGKNSSRIGVVDKTSQKKNSHFPHTVEE